MVAHLDHPLVYNELVILASSSANQTRSRGAFILELLSYVILCICNYHVYLQIWLS